ncbi:MAG: hypothetical protein B6D39_06600 [Anaerolineae bacterium UTCFX2]|nr:hypothetical protein [Anaerolineales bacterium]OQY91616.1 MAG: hypothetical protein B6D39_06600 [Anaerolineae bacterium UTCFX2]
MTNYHVCVVGGWCGNRMVMVAEYLTERLSAAGYPCHVTTHSVWDNFNQPPAANLILQLLPAFTESEVECPVLTIKLLLADINHAETIERILRQVRADYHL